MRRGIALLPNLLTTANMFCGFFSITKSLAGKSIFAVWLIVLAGLFDFLDGRVARMTHTESRFGTEYDSLADLTTFCIAPAFLAYSWGLGQFEKFGLAIAFLYFACGALRLARFNVQSGNVEKNDFQGLPTPAAAGTLVTYILFHNFLFGHFPELKSPLNFDYLVLAGLCFFLGMLMVSQVRYKSTKAVKRRSSFVSLILIVAVLFVILAKPEIMLFAFGVCYISYGIINWFIETSKKSKNIAQLLQGFFMDPESRSKLETPDDPRTHYRSRRRARSPRPNNIVKLSPTPAHHEKE